MRRAPREVATFELRKKASWWPERKSMPRLWVCCVLVAWVSSPGGCAENVMSSESGYLMRQHSLAASYQGRTTYVPTKGVICRSAVYTGTGLEIPYWEFGGASVVTSSYVRLTPDRQSKQGNLWNPVVRLSLHRPSLSLSLSLALSLTLLSLPHTHTHTHLPLYLSSSKQPFRVHNWEVVVQFSVHGQGQNLFGDGFALWYTKNRGNLGKRRSWSECNTSYSIVSPTGFPVGPFLLSRVCLLPCV